jgi:hypothetical protein
MERSGLGEAPLRLRTLPGDRPIRRGTVDI